MTRRLAVIAVVLLSLTACDKNTPDATPSAVTSLGTPTAQATATSTPTSNATTTAPPTGPRIVYFRVKTKPSCPSSGPGVSYPGNDTKLEWEVTGGPTGVQILLDGGLWSNYPTTDVQDVAFACDGPSNSTKKHTYTLKTVGGGPVVQQSITVEAHVN